MRILSDIQRQAVRQPGGRYGSETLHPAADGGEGCVADGIAALCMHPRIQNRLAGMKRPGRIRPVRQTSPAIRESPGR